MPGLDPGLVVHMLNIDPEAKPVAQFARVFHTEIEEQIVKEVQKLYAHGAYSWHFQSIVRLSWTP